MPMSIQIPTTRDPLLLPTERVQEPLASQRSTQYDPSCCFIEIPRFRHDQPRCYLVSELCSGRHHPTKDLNLTRQSQA